MVNRPDLVKYNTNTLPKAPEGYILQNDPSKTTVAVAGEPVIPNADIEKKVVKVKRWKTSFTSAVQLSQAYVSDNWYQGGTSSLNLLSDQLFTISYNDPSGKLLF